MELKRQLHCKPFSWYLKHVYPELVIPTSEGGPGGALKQGTACLDSMGHLLDGNVGLYPCHDTGGNQVRKYRIDLRNYNPLPITIFNFQFFNFLVNVLIFRKFEAII